MAGATQLAFPSELSAKSSVSKLLYDFPWIGLRDRQRKFLVQCLKDRCDFSMQDVWPEDSTRNTAEVAAEIIQRNLRWPTANFLPDDPCELLFFASGDGMDTVSALSELIGKFPIPDSELNKLLHGNFAMLVRVCHAVKLG